MGHRPCTFRESDLRRALRAAKKEGVTVVIKINDDGMTITSVKASDVSTRETNPWDEVLDNATDQKRAP